MVIRLAEKGEGEAVIAFYYNLIDKMKDAKYPLRWQKGIYPVSEDIERAIDERSLYMATEKNQIVSTFILNHKQGEGYENAAWPDPVPEDKVAVMHLLATDPDRQGQGIGKMMLEKAEEICRERHDQVIRLDTLTWNVPGIKLYEGFGFKYCGDIAVTYGPGITIPFRTYEYKL